MTRGEGQQTRVHFKGSEDDFLVFVENASTAKKWLSDKTIPLVDVVGNFKVYASGKQGTQGFLSEASKQALENEFGTSNDDEVIRLILEKGTLQEVEDKREREGNTNLSRGSRD